MFVDSENPGAGKSDFPIAQIEMVAIPLFDGGTGQAEFFGEMGLGHAVMVSFGDFPSKSLGGPPAGEYAGKALIEVFAAGFAKEFVGFEKEKGGPFTEGDAFEFAGEGALDSEGAGAAMGAGRGALDARRES